MRMARFMTLMIPFNENESQLREEIKKMIHGSIIIHKSFVTIQVVGFTVQRLTVGDVLRAGSEITYRSCIHPQPVFDRSSITKSSKEPCYYCIFSQSDRSNPN